MEEQNMKKYAAIAGMIFALGLAAGCGTQGSTAGGAEGTAGTEQQEAQKSVTGVIDEIVDDYYFSIQTEDGTYYQFPLSEEADFELGDAAVGDTIQLFYDGELSEVDMFDGTLSGCELIEE